MSGGAYYWIRYESNTDDSLLYSIIEWTVLKHATKGHVLILHKW